MFSESSRTALWLCRQAGCLCLDDDNVHCSIDRAASTTWAYARFAAKCETPAWCTCEPPGKSRTKKPDGTRYIELPERIASEVCLRKGQPGYCLPGVPKGEPNLCCDGLQCLEEPLSSPSLQLGIQKTLEFGLGTCVDSLNSRSAQPKRAPPVKYPTQSYDTPT